MGDTKNGDDFTRAIAACLCSDTAPQREPSEDVVELVKAALYGSSQRPEFAHFSQFVDSPPSSRNDLQSLQDTISHYLSQCHDTVSLVYGGATKIKGYVFESPRLPEIRGASALLDWINGPALTGLWIETLKDVVPAGVAEQCIVYASGGNILGFAPSSKGQELATKIEHCYTEHTLTANSVAVAADFSLLELRYGRNPLGYWVEQFLDDWKTPAKRKLLEQYYYYPPNDDIPDDDSDAAAIKRFFNRKTFGELVTVLATMANRRRDERAAHGEERSVPFYMLMPWDMKCDSSDVRPAVGMTRVGDESTPISKASARKRYIGQRVKREREDATRWFRDQFGEWDIEGIANDSWETKWRDYLDLEENKNHPYATACKHNNVRAARDVHEIGAASKGGYIGLIYADGNNVGRLIATLTTPQAYADTSGILADAAVDAVFKALLDQLGGPAKCVARSGQNKGQEEWVHPFEILAIGGDDLLLIVPGSKAFEIALAIGYEFEQMLAEKLLSDKLKSAAPHSRYAAPSGKYIPYIEQFDTLRPKLGLSAGVVIAHHNAPIFFLQQLVEQLLKSAKKLARKNATQHKYYGGAVDFMVMKSISMVTDKISTFRRDALGDARVWDKPENMCTKQKQEKPVYSLTARPYTWHEFAGLLESVKQIKTEDVPRSQLYRLREVLMGAHERSEGIVRSVMEYLYTRARLTKHAHTLEQHIDTNWCVVDRVTPPLPPWRKVGDSTSKQWETVWADIIEMYDMVEKEENDKKEAGNNDTTLP